MKQAERIFMISDAAKQVEVEAHVLRYWEDELKLPVKRNEMGHRYYTKDDINLFRKIKEWKEQGLQLKAIRNMLKNGHLKEPMMIFGINPQTTESESDREVFAEETEVSDLARRHLMMVKKGEVVQSSIAPLQEESREQKSRRLQQLLSEMIAQAVQSNNRELCEEIKESLLKELDYQFRLQEEKEDERELHRISRQEEHYRQIDELIRSHNPKGRAITDKKAEKQRLKEEKQKLKESKGASLAEGKSEIAAVAETEKGEEKKEEAEKKEAEKKETEKKGRMFLRKKTEDRKKSEDLKTDRKIIIKRKRSIV